MKKLTVTQFATRIRNTYPNRFKNLGDVELTFKWLKEFPDDRKYLDELDAAKGGIKWGADGVINFFKKGVEKVKDKVQPQSQDSTQTQTDSNWLQNVMGTINQIKGKSSSDTTNPTTQQPTPPQEKKVAPKFTSRFKTKKCDENTYPWTRGCVNNKIGQMNQTYFGDRYADTYGDELYMQLDSLGYFDAPGQKDGEITQYIYDGVMNDRRVDETKILGRKKVVKETVKNVLKERLKKK
jgi:hypothetical protein